LLIGVPEVQGPASFLSAVPWLSLSAGALSAAIIAVHILLGHRQRMWIMNAVWPLTALYSGPIGLAAYFVVGRSSVKTKTGEENKTTSAPKKSFWESTGIATTHCGAGCTLGDIFAEWFVVLVPLSLFGHRMFGSWLLDFIVAFAIGIAFQYFTIKPMRQLSAAEGVKAAIKADAASLTAWQIGMYGWMAIATFVIFHRELDQRTPLFWFMMQIGMLAGFVTSYPVNGWLLRRGLKESM
jgi:hypothetical protein